MIKTSALREEFIKAFGEAWGEMYGDPAHREQLEQDYACSSPGQRERWTSAICGTGMTDPVVKCLIAQTFDRMAIGFELRFDPERHKVDAFGRVFPRMVHEEHVDGVNVVMLEIENDTKKSYQEFWKLTQSRCPLKVLVTYEMPKDKALEDARDRMQIIYQDYCAVLGPDDPSTYLLVIGTRDEDSATIRWEYFGMSDAGRLDHEIQPA